MKFLTILGKCAVVFIIIAAILFIYLSHRSFVPDDYTTKVETGGEIEAEYLRTGKHEVSLNEFPVLQNFGKYSIHYPTDLATNKEQFPIVVICNGSGLPASKYRALQKHLASWGFVVIATEETFSWNGFGAEMSVRQLYHLDELKEFDGQSNIFYKKLDFGRVGILGHSQGGVCVFNSIAMQQHGRVFKTGIALSPTKPDLARLLQWDYDVSSIRVPIFLMASSEEHDYVDTPSLRRIYDAFPSNQLHVMATRNNASHNDMLYYGDGYVTAWMMWQLQHDEKAARAFNGNNAEILKNKLYRNQLNRDHLLSRSAADVR